MAVPELAALWIDGELRAPAVGLWRGAPAEGEIVSPGESLGQLEVLGVLHRLVAPAGARGVVVGSPSGVARVAVGYGDVLVRLDPLSAAAARAEQTDSAQETDAGGLALRAPTSGRFYCRPGPGKDAFVEAGDEVSTGTTVCLLEVMKTFNRVVYGGDGLPERARVIAVVPEDESDLDAGDIILQLEPA
jgi:acetyl-CoA carboxylase biotin carboxyl carrier protein